MSLEKKNNTIGKFPTPKQMFEEYRKQQRLKMDEESILMQVLSENQHMSLIELMYDVGGEDVIEL